MIKKIKRNLLIIVSMLTVAAPIALPAAVSYAECGSNGQVANTVANGAAAASGPNATVGCDPTSGINSANAGTQVGNLAATIVNIFSIVVGAAAIIMIIYAGFRYITSGGSTERIGGAKTTLIYAIIGLVVVALAQILVHFVLSSSISVGNNLSS